MTATTPLEMLNRFDPPSGTVVESIEREHPGTMVLVPARDVPFLFASARSR